MSRLPSVPSERLAFVAIIVAAFVVRLAFAIVTPPLQAPDERAHERFVEHVAIERSLPVQPELEPHEALGFWPQYYQPPLAYLTLLPTWWTFAAAGDDAQLRALRVQNAAYGAATAAVAYLLVAALTTPGDPRRALAAVFVALLPGFAAKTSAVNNDALANLLAAVLWLPLLARDLGRWRPWLAGLVFGAAALAKLTVLPLAPLLVLAPLLRSAGDWRNALREGAIAGGTALALMLPWLIRNGIEYGSPLGIGAGSFPLERIEALIPEASRGGGPRLDDVARQFVGAFGVFQTIHWVPLQWSWAGVIAIGLLGFGRAAPADRTLDRASPLLLAACTLSGLGLAYFGTAYHGGWQGRYLFPALVPFAALVASGAARWLPERRAWLVVTLLAMTLFALDLALAEKLRDFYTTAPHRLWRQAAHL